MLGDPAAGGQLLEQCLVEPPWRAVVDILDRRLAVAKLRSAQPAFEPLCTAVRRFAIEHQRQPFGRAKILRVILCLQLDKGVRHAVEPEGSKLVDGGVGQH
jgi:hypothetical protein